MKPEAHEQFANTLGEFFAENRKLARLSLEKVSEATRIPASVLSHLENGAYDKLPPDAFLRGIVKKYAVFLGMDSRECLRRYDEEAKRFRAGGCISGSADLLPANRFSAKRQSVSFGIRELVFLVALGAFLYLVWQAGGFVRSPSIDLDPALGDNTIARQAEFAVSGILKGAERLTINGERIGTGARGRFSYIIELKEGENIVEFRAKDARGRTATVIRRIIFKPENYRQENQHEAILNDL